MNLIHLLFASNANINRITCKKQVFVKK